MLCLKPPLVAVDVCHGGGMFCWLFVICIGGSLLPPIGPPGCRMRPPAPALAGPGPEPLFIMPMLILCCGCCCMLLICGGCCCCCMLFICGGGCCMLFICCIGCCILLCCHGGAMPPLLFIGGCCCCRGKFCKGICEFDTFCGGCCCCMDAFCIVCGGISCCCCWCCRSGCGGSDDDGGGTATVPPNSDTCGMAVGELPSCGVACPVDGALELIGVMGCGLSDEEAEVFESSCNRLHKRKNSCTCVEHGK